MYSKKRLQASWKKYDIACLQYWKNLNAQLMDISLSLYVGLIKALIDNIDMCSKILNCRTLPLISGYTMIDFLTT